MNIVGRCFDSSCGSVSVERRREANYKPELIAIYPESGSSLFYCPFDEVTLEYSDTIECYMYFGSDTYNQIIIRCGIIATPYPKEFYMDKGFPKFTKTYKLGEPMFRLGSAAVQSVVFEMRGDSTFKNKMYEYFGVPNTGNVDRYPVMYHHTERCNANNGKVVVSVFPLEYYDGYISGVNKNTGDIGDYATPTTVASCQVFLLNDGENFSLDKLPNNEYESFKGWSTNFETFEEYDGTIKANEYNHFNIYGVWEVNPGKRVQNYTYSTQVGVRLHDGFYNNLFNGKSKTVVTSQIYPSNLSLDGIIYGGGKSNRRKDIPPSIFEEWDFERDIDKKLFMNSVAVGDIVGSEESNQSLVFGFNYSDAYIYPVVETLRNESTGYSWESIYRFLYIEDGKVTVWRGYSLGPDYPEGVYFNCRNAYVTPQYEYAPANVQVRDLSGFDENGTLKQGGNIDGRTTFVVKIRDYKQDDDLSDYLPILLFTMSRRNGGGFLNIANI